MAISTNYKSYLYKYIIGEFTTEKPILNFPMIVEDEETSGNIISQIATQSGNAYTDVIIKGKLYSEIYQNYLIYGFDGTNNFIAIVDDSMNLVQYITSFASGSNLFTILSLQIDENYNIYGISQDTENGNNVVRILLLNNIFTSYITDGTYKVKLRNSYIVPSGYNLSILGILTPKDTIKKALDEATYFITGSTNSGVDTLVIKFTINVGSSNTWETYTISNAMLPYADFTVLTERDSNNDLVYRLYAIDINFDPLYSYKQYKIINSVSLEKTISLTRAVFNYSQVLALNKDDIYIVEGNTQENDTYLYKVNGNSLTLMRTFYGRQSRMYTIVLENINDTIFLTGIEPVDTEDYYELRWGIVEGISCNMNPQGADASYLKNRNLWLHRSVFFLFNRYDLYILNMGTDSNFQHQDEYVNTRRCFIYDSDSYNGTPYRDYNLFKSKLATLYDENEKLLFARSLYNKTTIANQTTSTVEIPFTLLNGNNIATENLIGETNDVLNNDDISFTKNIYENVFINFITSINVIDNENDFISGSSSFINNNINTGTKTSYENGICNKVRITYADATTKVFPITWNFQQTIFSIYVNKEISKVAFVSNDLTTEYIQLDYDFEIGKTYTIRQRLRVR